MKQIILIILILIGFLKTKGQESSREFEMENGDTTYIMKQYIICFLNKGPNREQPKEEADKIQTAHLAHLDSLAKIGKIAIAGPFGDDGTIRGIVIYDVASVEEAKQLAGIDPAVKSGRLVMDFHPWWAAKGSVLP